MFDGRFGENDDRATAGDVTVEQHARAWAMSLITCHKLWRAAHSRPVKPVRYQTAASN